MNLLTKRSLWSWRKSKAVVTLLALLLSQWHASFQLVWAQVNETVSYTDLVAVLVEDALLLDPELKSKIYRYAEDVQRATDGQALVVGLPTDTSVKDIHEGLSEWYWSGYRYDDTTRLAGVVLVGDLPIPVVDKSGRLWPTVFPYVDFEAPLYAWDDHTARFVSQRTRKAQAEVWHGLIRGSSEVDSVRREQIRQYFDKNHQVHTGAVTFGKKVLQANLPAQQNAVPETLLNRYDAWIKHAEDLHYLRFTKHLANLLQSNDNLLGSVFDETDQAQMIDKLAAASPELDVQTITESLNDSGTAEMPDIYSHYLIDKLAVRYQDLYQHWLSQINEAVSAAGRWDGAAVETLPSLVSTRDEAAVLYLRQLNDRLERDLLALVETVNVANRPWVQENTTVQYWEDDGLGGRNYISVQRPNYWNGVPRDANFTVQDCTLNRGNLRTSSRPAAQQVSANRTFDPTTGSTCAGAGSPDDQLEADPYEGCCAVNMTYESGVFGFERCDTGSLWTADEGLDSVIHQGAEQPVFAIEGTTEVNTNTHGAAGCLSILATNVDEGDAHRFASLMLHQEPTPETITAQLTAGTTNALPVDDPRGFSFLDHGLTPQRVAFVNLFSLRTESVDVSNAESILRDLLTAKIEELNQIITTGNQAAQSSYNAFRSGCAGTFTETNFDDSTVRAVCDSSVRFFEKAQPLKVADFLNSTDDVDPQQLATAVNWLDLSVAEKNKQVLSLSQSDATAWSQALLPSQSDGYELAMIVADGTADSVALNLDSVNAENDAEFLAAQRAGLQNTLSPLPELTFEGVDFDETFQDSAALSACDDLGSDLTSWADRLECQLKNTPTGGTVSLFVPDLGKKNKTRSSQIGDPALDIEDLKLRVTPDKVLVHNQSIDPVPVTVYLTNQQNQIQKNVSVDHVSLRFSSPSVGQFFSIFPDKKVVIENGRADFWLVPKTQEYGGKFALIAEAVKGDQTIRSAKVPLVVPRYRAQLTTLTPSLNVKDPTGVPLELRILDAESQLTAKATGKKLSISATGGVIEGGETVTVSDLVTPLVFFPGDKAGEATITIQDPAGELAPDQITIQLLPDEPAAIKLETAQRYAFPDGPLLEVTATITDAYNNPIEDLLHEFSWNTDNAEIVDLAVRDESPRRAGVQEVVRTGIGSLLVAPENSAPRVEVSTDKLPRAGRSLEWEWVKNPALVAELSDDSSVAGAGDLTLTVLVTDEKGGRLNGDFVGQVWWSHLGKTEPLTFTNGIAEVDFSPGTLAGEFTGQVMLTGVPTQSFDFRVLPGEATKLVFVSDREIWPLDQSLSLKLQAQDAFGNQAALGGTALVKASDLTNDLIAPLGNISLQQGIADVALTPTGQTGTLNLIAQRDGLLPATLSLNLTQNLSLTDLSQLSPRALLSLWLGFESGKITTPANVANTLLHAGAGTAVGGLMSEAKPAAEILVIAPNGDFTTPATVRLVTEPHPRIDFELSNAMVASTRINFGREIDAWLDTPRSREGVYIDAVPRFTDDLLLRDGTLYLKNTPILAIQPRGGVTILSSDLTTQIGENITEWELAWQHKKLGTLNFYLPGAPLIVTKNWQSNTAGVQLITSENSTYDWQKTSIGNHHASELGWSLVETSTTESARRSLGGVGQSAEDSQTLSTGWIGDWKPGTLLAAGNNIGESTRLGASDIFVLYGDPTLSLEMTPAVQNGLSEDIGRVVWSAPWGDIENLVSGDFLRAGSQGVLVQIGNQFRYLVPQDNTNLNWSDWGELLRVDAGVDSVIGLTGPRTDDLAILDTDGALSVYDLSTGNWQRSPTNFEDLVWIGAGRFNADDEADLAFVDRALNLGVAMRTGNAFSAPIYLGSLAPKFTDIDERSTDEAVSYLGSTWIGYAGIETNQALAQDIQSIVVTATDKTSIDLETLSESITAGGLGDNRYAVSVPLDPSIESRFQLSSSADSLRPGDRLSARLTLRSDLPHGAAHVMLPSDDQLDLDKASLNCVGCATTPKFFKQDGFGAAWVYLDKLPARSQVTLTWDYEVAELALRETISIVDRDSDGIDDLVVSRADRLLTYLSRDQKYESLALIPALDAEQRIEYQGVPNIVSIDENSSADGFDLLAERLAPMLEDEDLMAATLAGQLAADADGDGLPDSFDAYPTEDNFSRDGGGVIGDVGRMVQDFSNKKQNLLCGYGSCFDFPISKVLGGLAPGLDSIYIPPITIPRGMDKGKPMLSWPTTNPSGSPSIYPPDKKGRYSEPTAPHKSVGRLYLMPTTTGHLGIAYCKGLYPLHMISPVWNTNCQVVTPKIDFLGVCTADEDLGPDDDSLLAAAVTTALARSGSVIQVDPQGNLGANPGQFTANLDFVASGRDNRSFGPANINIPGIDLVSDWLQAQMREFSSFGMKLPAIQLNFKDRAVEGVNASQNLSAKDQAVAQLSKYEVNIERRAITLPYPNITGPDLEGFMAQFKNWKANLELNAVFDVSLPDLSKVTDQLKSFVASLENISFDTDLDLSLSLNKEFTTYLDNLKSSLAQLRSDYDKFCVNNPEPQAADCDVALNVIVDLEGLERSLDEWKSALGGIDLASVQSEFGNFSNDVSQLVSSVENLKDIRIKTESLVSNAQTNLETLEAYQSIPETLAEVPEKSKAMLGMAADGVAHMEKFMGTYAQDLDARMTQWEQAIGMISSTFKVFDNAVLKVMANFSNNCRTCVADRGTMLSWLLKILVGAIDMPVFTLPEFPDIVLDFTGLDLGLTFVIPDKINFKPIQVELFTLPELEGLQDLNVQQNLELVANIETPDLSSLTAQTEALSQELNRAKTIELNLPDLGTLPSFSNTGGFTQNVNLTIPQIAPPNIPTLALNLPSLPEIPAIDIVLPEIPLLPQISVPKIDIPTPTLALPKLPTLPGPPQLPLSLIDSVAAVVEVPFGFLDLFCLLRLGAAPVPEWYVKPYVEQLTNRSELSFGLDFGALSIKDFSLGVKPIEVGLALSFAQVFDPVSKITDSIGASSEALIRQQTQDAYRGVETPNIPTNLGSDLQAVVPTSFKAVAQWANKYQEVYRENYGKTVSPDEFWSYFQYRLGAAKPASLAQQELQKTLLGLHKPKMSKTAVEPILAHRFTEAEEELDAVERSLNKDLTLVESLSTTPWSQWAANPDIQSQQRFLATTEVRQLQLDAPSTFRDLTTDTSAAQVESDGSIAPIVPDLLDLSPAVVDSTPKPDLPVDARQPEPGLYYVSNTNQTSQRLTAYPVRGDTALLMTDINGDGADEIWWTDGSNLYLKDTQAAVASQPESQSVTTVGAADFVRVYAPGAAPLAKTFHQTQTLSFDDLSMDLNYWEWILSDHYEIRKDIRKRPANRVSRTWQRFAYTDIVALQETGVKIDYIAGDPVFDRAIEVGDILKAGFTVTLDADDQVELVLPDGSGVSLLSNEAYALQPIKRGEVDTRLKRQVDQSGFGVLVGIRDNVRSHLSGPFYHLIDDK